MAFEDSRIKVFMEVAREGSFSRAAARLGVSPSAVSQSVSALEKQAGARLFDRRRGGDVSLTPSGLTFLSYAEKIAYWYRAADLMVGESGLLSGGAVVRIAADPVVASYLLPRALSLIHGAHPALRFATPCPGDEGADVRMGVSPSPETMDFEGESKLLGVMDAAVVASPLNARLSPAADAAEKPFSTLAGVHVSNGFAVWEPYMDLISPDIAARVVFSSSSVEAVKTVVRGATDLVGIVPSLSVREQTASRELLLMPVSLPDFAFDIHFDPRADFAPRQICALLRQTLKECVYGL